MLCGVVTFVVTVGGIGLLTFLAGRRLAAHVRRHPEARRAIAEFAEHVILPLFEKPPEVKPPPSQDGAAPPAGQ
jgi:hypothetical protein